MLVKNQELEEARNRTERAILEAEKFRANVDNPDPGIITFVNNKEMAQDTENILNIGAGVSDDDFFHLTCHIDPTLIHKIEKVNLLNWKNFFQRTS